VGCSRRVYQAHRRRDPETVLAIDSRIWKAGAILFMTIICGIVWGGFVYCLVLLARQPQDDRD
jgi:hypothetical protein